MHWSVPVECIGDGRRVQSSVNAEDGDGHEDEARCER